MSTVFPENNSDPTRLLKRNIERWGTADREVFSFREISNSETVDLIGSMGNSKTYGHDELDALTLKLIAPNIIAPVRHMINLSFKNSMFANRWKDCSSYPPA